MNKRPHFAENDESYRDWYFNVKPDTGDRLIEGYFLPASGDASANLVNRLVNVAVASKPVDDISTCIIDVDPSSQDGFVATDIEDGNYRLMMKLVDFTAVNAPINIEEPKQNDRFWVWEDWDGSPALQSTELLWAGNMKEYKIPAAYYPDQQSLFDIMKDLTADTVKFDFDSAELVTYTGDKPLILPLSANFSPTYYKSRTSVDIVDSNSTVPSNISGLVVVEPSEFVISSSINGAAVQMKVQNPEYVLDYLAVKLGFTSTNVVNKDKFRTYFGYPQISGFPNTASTTDAITFLSSGEMTIAIVIYPLCKANTFGFMYGSMSNINIVSSDIDTPTPAQNVIAKIGVAQYSTFAQFQFESGVWYPLSKATGKNKYFTFKLVDNYNRPYKFASGVPYIKVAVSCRSAA
jgi:hypothetical protein